MNTATNVNKPPVAPACYHCGEACPPQPVRLEEKAFCCEGCRSVYTLLSENNLCTYYNLEQQPGQTVKATHAHAFDHLDQPEIIANLAEFTDGDLTRITFDIPTIHCSSCIYLLDNLTRLHPAIQQSEVNFSRKQVRVLFRRSQLPLSQLAALLHRVGYPPVLNLDKADPLKPQADATKRLVYQIGVTGFCFGNIMLLSFPDYLAQYGVEHGLQNFFNYLNLLLALPIFFYGAQDYLKGAWKALRNRYFSIDMPLALGILAMFFRSTYEVVSQTGTGFFDSMGGLVFFLLVGKYFQQRTYSFLSFERDYRSYFPLAARKLTPNGTAENEVSIPVTHLKPGDRIVIRHGELVPTDALLAEGEGAIDYSFVTGESLPQPRRKGEQIFAGGRQMGGRIELIVQRPTRQSTLTDLWNHSVFRKENEGGYIGLIQTISKYFTLVVLVLAAVVGLFWLAVDPSKALNAFTAVLIIACPCALALTTPFAFGHITRIFGRHGLYLKNADTVERMARVDHLVFDKTGTLTSSRGTELEFVPLNENLTDTEQQALWALARQSAHPLSVQIAHHLAETLPQHTSPATENWQEIPGKGISATVDEFEYRLGSWSFIGLRPAVEVEENSYAALSVAGVVRGLFLLRQSFREQAAPVLDALKATYPLSLVSGDGPAARAELQKWFAPNQLHFQAQPADKLAHVQALIAQGKQPAMIGDGLNDAGALKQAFCGIALSEDTSRFTPASDAILDARAFGRLPQLLALSRKSLQVVKLCFAVSLLYNLTGTWFAVQGELSPLIAAILMPFSSIGIISVATAATYWHAWRLGLWPLHSSDQPQNTPPTRSEVLQPQPTAYLI